MREKERGKRKEGMRKEGMRKRERVTWKEGMYEMEIVKGGQGKR